MIFRGNNPATNLGYPKARNKDLLCPLNVFPLNQLIEYDVLYELMCWLANVIKLPAKFWYLFIGLF
jgi:hypothetical protein